MQTPLRKNKPLWLQHQQEHRARDDRRRLVMTARSKRCHSRGEGRRLTSAPTTREPLPSPTTPPLIRALSAERPHQNEHHREPGEIATNLSLQARLGRTALPKD